MRAAVASSPIHIEVELKLLSWGQRDYTLGPVWSARLGEIPCRMAVLGRDQGRNVRRRVIVCNWADKPFWLF